MTTTVIFASIILVVGQVAIGVFLLEIVMRVMRGLDERAVAARRRGGECFEQFLQERSALNEHEPPPQPWTHPQKTSCQG
jgi:hypothetical protein